MRKRILKISLVVFGSLVILGSGIGYIIACADGDWDTDWNSSFFAPENAGTAKGFEPLFRSMQPFYKVGFISDFKGSFTEINTEEWSAFFKNKVTDADLNFFLYEARIGQVDTAIFFLKNPKYPLTEALRGNSLLKVENTSDAKDFLFYLGYAKRCEPYVTYVSEYWDEEKADDPKKQSGAIDKLIAGGSKAMTKATNGFIKERYAFQVERLHFMKGDYDAAISFYETNKALFNQNTTIQYRALGYLAGAHYKLGNYTTANYLYSQIYDRCAPMRLQAYQSFHPMEESDWEGCLALAQKSREREVLWQMLGVYVDPLRAMKAIYAINPKSDLLDLLLVRAINIDEVDFIPELYYSSDSVETQFNRFKLNSDAVNKQLVEFVSQVADKGNTATTSLWKLSAAYLNIASGNHDKGRKYLKAAERESNDSLTKDQARLLGVISLVETSVAGNAKDEDALAKELSWLTTAKKDESLRIETAISWSFNRLSEKYAAIGDFLRAQCLNVRSNKSFYLSTDNCEAMKTFMGRKNISNFDRFILHRYPYNQNNIVEFQAIQLVLHHDLTGALAMMNTEKELNGNGFNADPFIIHINDCHDCDQTAEHIESYDVRSFIEKMLEYEQKAEQDPKKAAEYYFLMANGYYNITYFGNSRYFYSSPLYERSDVYFYWHESIKPDAIFDCSKAEEYYVKAMNLSGSKEFKAKCAFMAAKCEQNAFFVQQEQSSDIDFRAGNYFKMLKENFSTTKYYKEVIKECGYFRTYLNGKS